MTRFRKVFDGIVDPFAGPGGWSTGLCFLGIRDEVGIESDAAACATRAAAGHRTIRADVGAYPAERFAGARGLIMSPPCQAFSAAGSREGAGLVPALLEAVERRDWGFRPSEDPRVWLVLDVGRWIDAIRPEWIALEQVPAVLPLWKAYARYLHDLGYSAWAGELNAADYGVPQTRKRAILVASRTTPAHPPAPTHDRDPVPGLFGTLEPWVTMAEALGWVDFALDQRRGAGMIERHGDRPERTDEDPAPTITTRSFKWDVVPTVNTGLDWKAGQDRSAAQTIDASANPAPAVTTRSGGQWHLNPGRTSTQPNRRLRPAHEEPAPTLAFGHDSANWAWVRPPTTIAGDSRCWPPGHKINAADEARLGVEEARERYGDRAGTEAIRLSVRDALLLQTFPENYPVQGTKTVAFRQIGDAVPPRLAAHIIATLEEPPR